MFRSPAGRVMRAQQCDPAGGYAHRFMRTVTPYSARWPDHLRVGNAAHAHIKGLTRRSRGLRANRGVRAHIQGLACEWTARLRLQTLRPRDHRLAREQSTPGIVPKRRPPHPQQLISALSCRGGLHFGHIFLPSFATRAKSSMRTTTLQPSADTALLMQRQTIARHSGQHTISTTVNEAGAPRR